jgi:hypothetical protein
VKVRCEDLVAAAVGHEREPTRLDGGRGLLHRDSRGCAQRARQCICPGPKPRVARSHAGTRRSDGESVGGPSASRHSPQKMTITRNGDRIRNLPRRRPRSGHRVVPCGRDAGLAMCRGVSESSTSASRRGDLLREDGSAASTRKNLRARRRDIESEQLPRESECFASSAAIHVPSCAQSGCRCPLGADMLAITRQGPRSTRSRRSSSRQ